MRVAARPKAELHPFLVLLARVMNERDVELGLELRVVFATALCELEERLVSGVVGERLREFMVCGEINAEGRETREEVRLIRIEQVREGDALGIRAPVEEEVEEIPAARPQGEIEGGVPLEVRIVAVAEEKQGERVVSRLKRDLEGRREAPSLDRHPLCCLQRTASTNPVLDGVKTALATELVKFGQRHGIRCRPRERRACAGLRI